MSKKIVLLLQGGGALGAFQCGAWRAISSFIRDNGHELAAVVGASIGAINAGLIARHCRDADGGSGLLLDFWRNRLATVPFPFIPLPEEYWRSWNGFLTGALLGNPALFAPAYQHWNPIGDMFRFQMPLYRTHRAVHTLAQVFGDYRGMAPLLAVAASDVQSGEGVLFDSASRTITPGLLAAGIAIPLLFPPAEIDGRRYWDFEMRSNTLLPSVFGLLRRALPASEAPQDYLVIVVDMFRPETKKLPVSAIDSYYRLLNIVLGNKLGNDYRAFEVGNAYLGAIERIHHLAGQYRHSPLAAAIEEEYQKLLAARHARVELLHIGREQFKYEHISRDFDYSPQYIARLIEQGFENASNVLESYQENLAADKEPEAETMGSTPRRIDGARSAGSH